MMFEDRHAPAQTVRSPWARAGQDVDSSATNRGVPVTSLLTSDFWADEGA